MNINKNHIILISIFTLLFSIGIYFISQAFDSEKYYYVTNLKRITINIPENSDIEDVIYLLEENGDLEGELIFKVIAAAKGYSQNIKPGKIILEDRIKKRLNKSLGARTVQEMYFQKYVVQ